MKGPEHGQMQLNEWRGSVLRMLKRFSPSLALSQGDLKFNMKFKYVCILSS